MGYESKVYVVRKSRYFDYNEVIAMVDLSKMGYWKYNGKTFRDLFTLPLEGEMYRDDGNTLFEKDCYDDDIEGAHIEDVLEWLREFNQHEDYWRAKAFQAMLESFSEYREDLRDLYCYHYGY